MAKKSVIDSIKVRANGATLDLDELYKRMWRWFEMMGYAPKETEYREATDGSGAQSMEIRWECTREVDKLCSYIVRIDFFLLGVKEVEVDKAGIKSKLMKGNFEILVVGLIDYAADYNTPFLAKLKLLYQKYVLFDRWERQEKDFRIEVNALVAEIKTFFGLYGALV
ncbi:MAG: hypothetical protein Q7R56_02145 [Nanoarchaeota archaeon]|nr:hypothetical protein [Nanoarchaeota archaeon]